MTIFMDHEKLFDSVSVIIRNRILNWTPKIFIAFLVLLALLSVVVYKTKWEPKKKVSVLCFGAYCYEVLVITLFSRKPSAEYAASFVPIVLDMADNPTLTHQLLEIFFNVLFFVPLGFFLSWFFKWEHRYRNTILVGLAATLFIEITQYITKLGTMELDDIISNTLGALVGALLFKLVKRVVEKHHYKSVG